MLSEVIKKLNSDRAKALLGEGFEVVPVTFDEVGDCLDELLVGEGFGVDLTDNIYLIKGEDGELLAEVAPVKVRCGSVEIYWQLSCNYCPLWRFDEWDDCFIEGLYAIPLDQYEGVEGELSERFRELLESFGFETSTFEGF